MKDAGFVLVVRFSIEAQAEARVLRWLDEGHVAEVLRQKGFLWCRRPRERAPFEKHMRIERFAGEVESDYSV